MSKKGAEILRAREHRRIAEVARVQRERKLADSIAQHCCAICGSQATFREPLHGYYACAIHKKLSKAEFIAARNAANLKPKTLASGTDDADNWCSMLFAMSGHLMESAGGLLGFCSPAGYGLASSEQQAQKAILSSELDQSRHRSTYKN